MFCSPFTMEWYGTDQSKGGGQAAHLLFFFRFKFLSGHLSSAELEHARICLTSALYQMRASIRSQQDVDTVDTDILCTHLCKRKTFICKIVPQMYQCCYTTTD